MLRIPAAKVDLVEPAKVEKKEEIEKQVDKSSPQKVLNLIADYRREVKSEIQSIEDKISHIEAMMAAFLTKLTKYEVAHSVADSGYSWAKDGDQRDEDRLL